MPFRFITPLTEISIHALRKESDALYAMYVIGTVISIHALRKESDPTTIDAGAVAIMISIHALRKESDNQLRCTMIDVM